MTGAQKRQRQPGGAGATIEHMRELYGGGNSTARKPWESLDRLPRGWRDRLPNPASYYGKHVAKLSKPNATGWAQGKCPFHEDRNASLSVCLTGTHGGWRCFAGCGKGDMIGFHVRVTGKGFTAAVADLLGVHL